MLQYDGVNWTLFELPFAAHDLWVESKDIIWVCGTEAFGYVTLEDGKFNEYVPMLDKLDYPPGLIGEIWNIVVSDDALFAFAQESLIVYQSGEIQLHALPSQYRLTGCFDGSTTYISQSGVGLMEFKDGAFTTLIPQSEEGAPRVNSVITLEENEQLFSSFRKGLFQIENGQYVPWESEIKDLLSNTLCYDMIQTRDGRILCATHNYGILILSPDGKYLGQISEKDGLISNLVFNIFEDTDGNIWASHEIGVSLIEIQSSYMMIDSRNGLDSNIIYSLSIWDNQLIAGTANGCKTMDFPTAQSLRSNWQSIGAKDSPIWYILNTPKGPLISDKDGYSLLIDGQLKRALNTEQDGIYSAPLQHNGKDYIAITELRNAHLTAWKGDQLEILNLINAPGPLWSFIEHEGLIYAGSFNYGPLSIPADQLFSSQKIEATPLNAASLPETIRWAYFAKLPAGLVLLSDAGIFQKANGAHAWQRMSSTPDSLGMDPYAVNYYQGPSNTLWLMYNAKDSQYAFSKITWPDFDQPAHFEGIPTDGINRLDQIHCLIVDEVNSRVWVGGSGGIICENFDQDDHTLSKHTPIITTAQINGRPSEVSNEFKFPVSLAKFDFALPYYGNKPVTYQTRLLGQSTQWSSPSPNTLKEFTNLREGDYKFVVQALVDGKPNGVASYSFKILPPWRRTWSAYLLYLLLTIAFAYILVHFRTRRLRQANIALEEAVRSRTLELEKTNVRLAQANTAKNRFLANVSHEIRNPMNGIVGLAHLLLDDGLGKDRKRISHLLSTAEHLKVLLDGMLDFAAIENGQIRLQNCQFSLSALLDEVDSLHQRMAQDKGIKLYVIPNEEDCPELFGDIGKLRQILYNLTSNAIKFTHHGSVTVRTKAKVDTGKRIAELEFQIEDTGDGIPEEDQKRIFEQFNRGSQMNSQIKGIGLGLSIADRLTKILDGALTLDKSYTNGARFILQIQLSITDTPDRAPKRPDAERRKTLAGLQALVIEDEQYNQIVVEGLLKRESVRAIIAGSAEEALKIFVEHSWDFVLVDINLPGASGIEFAEMVKAQAQKANTPLIAMSAYVADFDNEKLMHAGITSFVPKPFTPDQLLTAIQTRAENQTPPPPTQKPNSTEPKPSRSLMEYIAGNDPEKLKKLEIELRASLHNYQEQLREVIDTKDEEKGRLTLHDMTPLIRLTQNQELIDLVDVMHNALHEDNFQEFEIQFAAFCEAQKKANQVVEEANGHFD
ncbi:ATP-binding protein [Cerasicoccus maritimus]|uniref:ATP-binding protein n=1 Tax=Cerasicoccus maritimus TaxID=490089 RepID=UPI002852B32C|nr:ATP-binding protein [Cerasicoccus maritimus]